jgi:hypothetical protein
MTQFFFLVGEVRALFFSYQCLILQLLTGLSVRFFCFSDFFLLRPSCVRYLVSSSGRVRQCREGGRKLVLSSWKLEDGVFQKGKDDVVRGQLFFFCLIVLFKTDHSTVCGWKGTANYYTVHDGKGEEKVNGAWYYPAAKDAAKNIEGYVAFYPAIKTK